jgi:hypothetical protein
MIGSGLLKNVVGGWQTQTFEKGSLVSYGFATARYRHRQALDRLDPHIPDDFINDIGAVRPPSQRPTFSPAQLWRIHLPYRAGPSV